MPTSENLIYALCGIVAGGVLGVWGGTYIGKLWARLEAYVKKDEAAAEAEVAHIKAIFSEVKKLIQEFDAKAKADATAAEAVVAAAKQAVDAAKSAV
jgi:hypothetical protein